ncbi:hypothetical protein D6783_00360 [Candidatus Woesearchaeota archaeon]|nr:MAG: hypothetical protein D6783_00360 [Candidatus Woesearchaeota archaeon]
MEKALIREANHSSSLRRSPKHAANIIFLAGIIAACSEQNEQPLHRTTSKEEQQATTTTTTLSLEEQQFLSAIQEHPTLSISSLYNVLGWSGRKGNKTRKQLEQKNIIAIDVIKGKKGWKKIPRIREAKKWQNTNSTQNATTY